MLAFAKLGFGIFFGPRDVVAFAMLGGISFLLVYCVCFPLQASGFMFSCFVRLFVSSCIMG